MKHMITKETSAFSRRIALKAMVAGALVPLAAPYVTRAAARRTIALMPKALSISVFSYAHYGAEARASELGDVDIVWAGPPVGDVNQQAEILSGLITRKVDGIGITALSPKPLLPLVNRAVDNGIVVTTWDSDIPGSKRLLYYGVDNYKMGQILGERAVELIGKKGKVVLESGNPAATDQNTRLKGVTDVLGKYPDIQTVGPFFNMDDLVKAQNLTNDLLLSHKDAAALVMVSGAALFGKIDAMPEMIKNNGKIKILSTDNTPTQMPFVKDGYVQVLVGQDYWGWGYQTVSMIYNILNNTSCKYPDHVPQDLPVIDASNVDSWIAKWDEATDVAGAAVVFKEAPIGCV